MTEPVDSRPTILVTGAAGQIGRELLNSLAALGRVHGIVRQVSRSPALAGCEVLDLADLRAVRTAVERIRPALIVNAAAYTAVDRAQAEVDAARWLNAELPGVLGAYCARAGAALVHFSTDYVFDGRGSHAWREDDAIGPLNVYGQTKADGEQAVREAIDRHLIVRTSWVYGAHGHNFVKTMLRLGASKTELRVVSDQVGAPTSARVIAEVTAQALAQVRVVRGRWLTEYGGTVHLACAGHTSWHGFAEEIFAQARALDVPLAVQKVVAIATSDYPTPAVRPLNSRLDLSLLCDRFGLEPPHWRDALAQSIEDIVRAVCVERST